MRNILIEFFNLKLFYMEQLIMYFHSIIILDIEQWWQDDGTKGLPKGVIESLRKVTLSNGLLSFERFCAGLKICLLRNQVEMQKIHNKQSSISSTKMQPKRPPSAPLLDLPGI